MPRYLIEYTARDPNKPSGQPGAWFDGKATSTAKDEEDAEAAVREVYGENTIIRSISDLQVPPAGEEAASVVMDGRLYQLLEGFVVAGMTGEFEDVEARPDGLLITLVDGSSWLLVAHPSNEEA